MVDKVSAMNCKLGTLEISQVELFCPFCEKRLDEIPIYRPLNYYTVSVYYCPHCKKVLGFANRFEGKY